MSMGSVAQCLLQRESVCGTFGAAQDGATEEDRKTGGQRAGAQGRRRGVSSIAAWRALYGIAGPFEPLHSL
jgi:hypothetical protein